MSTANEIASVVLKATLVPVAIMGGVLIYNMNDEVNKIKQEGALSTIVGQEIANNINQITSKTANDGVMSAVLGDKITDNMEDPSKWQCKK